jgi:hypothetical protein
VTASAGPAPQKHGLPTTGPWYDQNNKPSGRSMPMQDQ